MVAGINRLMERMRETSGITHRHFRSVFSCFIFSKVVAKLFDGLEKKDAYHSAMEEVKSYINTQTFNPKEIELFKRTISGRLLDAAKDDIYSSGYVLHTLEASIWSFLHTETYKDAVLRAVNLGGDTDTTSCVTGALAGLYYGKETIPTDWIETLVRRHDIVLLATNFQKCIENVILAKS